MNHQSEGGVMSHTSGGYSTIVAIEREDATPSIPVVRKWRPSVLDLSDRADFGAFAFLYTLFWPDAARRFRSAVAPLRVVSVRRPTIVAESRWPSTSYLAYLVGELGYSGVAASAAFSNWLRGLPDRRHITTCPDPDDGLGEFEHQVLPGQPVYLPAPTIPTTRWGFKPKTVVGVIL
jgi:hypothetical protein